MAIDQTNDTKAGTEAVDYWLTQFDQKDRDDAKALLSAIKNVGADEFQEAMMNLIRSRIESGPKPVGLFVESERRHRNGRVHRLFCEPRRKRRRAVGSGPKIIEPSRTVDPEVGSEGLIANIVTGVFRQCRNHATIHPGPDLIRSRKIRRFVLVTDFIGSGDRARRYLDAAWHVRSVRSWWSARRTKGMSFEVVAYSSTEDGLKNLKSHPSMPEVYMVDACPTIEQAFDVPEIRHRMRALCKRYGTRIRNFNPLGYGGTEALIAFAHGMPNNAPAIFHKEDNLENNSWVPLYPQLVTSNRLSATAEIAKQRDTIQRGLQRHVMREVLRSESYLSAPAGLKDAVRVLLALDRAPRNETVVSARTGFSMSRAQDAFARIHAYGWVDEHHLITDRGRRELSRLIRPPKEGLQFAPASIYIPRSLRAPRAI